MLSVQELAASALAVTEAHRVNHDNRLEAAHAQMVAATEAAATASPGDE